MMTLYTTEVEHIPIEPQERKGNERNSIDLVSGKRERKKKLITLKTRR